ncbi:MAG: hypothetical protein BWZ10_02574 [candidate division BRC1 bacterium ADurb.BinA364]|nr:MAG: hypothetical protein BWZ10_02574 [candidate division BRC1 bacterium ADurb.BinA364]
MFDWRVDQNQPELYPNRPILDAAPAARGYDPVCSRRYGELFNAGAGLPPGEPPRGFMFLPAIAHPRVFSLLNVRLVLSYLDPAQGALPETARIDFPEGPLRFFENADAAGPAFLARPAPLAPAEIEDPLLGLGRLLGPQFDWRAEALVERPHPRADAPADSAIEPALEIAESGYGRWRFRAACAEPSVLVLSQSWYPGWRVWIDGEEGEAVAADWALVGAFLDPGRHDVEFRYRPRALERGARASLAALALWLLLSGAAWIGATKNHR